MQQEGGIRILLKLAGDGEERVALEQPSRNPESSTIRHSVLYTVFKVFVTGVHQRNAQTI